MRLEKDAADYIKQRVYHGQEAMITIQISIILIIWRWCRTKCHNVGQAIAGCDIYIYDKV